MSSLFFSPSFSFWPSSPAASFWPRAW
jgi:hypothetical protein